VDAKVAGVEKNDLLTHLRGDMVVQKDDPTIAFRGKLDTLCAMILEAKLLGAQIGDGEFRQDLAGALKFVMSILPAEFKGTSMEGFRVLGFSHAELRERCRNPKKHFGIGHLLMDDEMGPQAMRLNLLRAAARETELSAVAAFRNPDAPGESLRPDILAALNALSSLFYVLIYKYLPEGYEPKGDPGF